MSELCRNNGTNDRLVDEWIIREFAALESNSSEHSALIDSVLLWWLGFGEPTNEDRFVSGPETRISAEQTQRLRQQRLLLSALRAASGEPSDLAGDESAGS